MEPTVSIIIPTFKRCALLLQTLDAVVKQSWKHWECIVVDDGGNDATETEMLKLVKNDARFQYYKRPQQYPKGACACRNFGFLKSKGKYIQWLDDDDLLSEKKLELQVTELEKQDNPAIFATCSWDLLWPGKELDLKNAFIGIEKINKENFYFLLTKEQTFVPQLCYLTPRELCLQAGEWNTVLSVNDDAEYFNRVLLHSQELRNVKDCYVLYREHEEARLSRKRSMQHIESFFLSLQLMQAYLKIHNIAAKSYFKWKLLKCFLAYRKTQPEILKKYRYLFLENGIYIKWSGFYGLKHKIYKKVYPFYKKLKA